MKPRAFAVQRPLACAALAFVLGILLGVRVLDLPACILLVVLSVLTTAALYTCRRSLCLYGVLCAVLALGALWGHLCSNPSMPLPGAYTVSGVVSGEYEIRERDGSAMAELRDVRLTDADGNAHRVSRLYWTFTPEDGQVLLTDGQRVAFEGTLYRPSGQMNPYGMDFEQYLWQRNIFAGISGAKKLQITGEKEYDIASFALMARKALSRVVVGVFAEQSELPLAMILGEREQMPQELTDAYSAIGITHVLAVSGLHVMVLLAPLLFVLSRLNVRQVTVFRIVFVILLLYCALLDFAIPVVRAGGIVLISIYARVKRRAHDTLTSMAVMCLVLLLARPLSLFSLSFQMTFGAVLGMELMRSALTGLRRTHDVLYRYISPLAATIGAMTGTLLPVVCAFHRVSPLAVLVSPLVCLLLSALLPACFFCFVLGAVNIQFGYVIATPARFVIKLLNQSILWLGSREGVSFSVPTPNTALLLLLLLLPVLWSGYVLLSYRRKAIVTACACALCVAVSLLTADTSVRYIQFSQGNADAAVILDGNETMVIDCAEHGGDLASYLQSTGRSIDTLVLTHAHYDHIGGLTQLLDKDIAIGRVIVPTGMFDVQTDRMCQALFDRLTQSGVPVTVVRAGDTFGTPRVRVSVMWPHEGDAVPEANANEYSMVTHIDLDGVSMLSAADITGTYEKYAASSAQVLKVSHHGSAGSTFEPFLALVKPQVALLSANGRTMPSYKTVTRLEQAGVMCLCTAETGALTLSVRDGTLHIRSFR